MLSVVFPFWTSIVSRPVCAEPARAVYKLLSATLSKSQQASLLAWSHHKRSRVGLTRLASKRIGLPRLAAWRNAPSFPFVSPWLLTSLALGMRALGAPLCGRDKKGLSAVAVWQLKVSINVGLTLVLKVICRLSWRNTLDLYDIHCTTGWVTEKLDSVWHCLLLQCRFTDTNRQAWQFQYWE